MKSGVKALVRYGCVVLLISVAQIAADGPVRANNFCSSINKLIEQSESGFDEPVAGLDQGASDNQTIVKHSQASKCDVSESLRGNQFHCVWKFPLQSEEAGEKFQEIGKKLQECFGHRAEMSQDQSVNHPDFYESYRFELADVDVTVSLKDKSELQSTLVNLRVKPNKR